MNGNFSYCGICEGNHETDNCPEPARMRKDIEVLQQRLLDRTEQALITARRDQSVIHHLKHRISELEKQVKP